MVIPQIEDYAVKDDAGNVLKDAAGIDIDYLDLTTEPDFMAGGKFDSGGTYNEDYRINAADKVPHFHKDMQSIFLSKPENSKYANYFTVFVIEDAVYDNAAGQIQEIGFKNLILFKNRNNLTICHEALHGLGLYHSHKDGIITKSDQKFVFVPARTDPLKATDNIMSYNGALRKSTCTWQWKIIKKHIL